MQGHRDRCFIGIRGGAQVAGQESAHRLELRLEAAPPRSQRALRPRSPGSGGTSRCSTKRQRHPDARARRNAREAWHAGAVDNMWRQAAKVQHLQLERAKLTQNLVDCLHFHFTEQL
jgi:hypothetical protein